jgi:hypothetical protein
MTASPTAPLDVSGNTILRNSVRIGSSDAPTVALDITGAVKVSSTLTTTGNVGIMTASPRAPLDVTGNTILRNWVRIGSSDAPTATLDVEGWARIAGTLDMVSKKIVNLANPTNDQDAATQFYVNAAETRATAVGSAAQTTANTAVTNAAAAQTTANTAVTNAAAAQTKANTVTTATTRSTATASAQHLWPAEDQSAGIITGGQWRMYVHPVGNIGIGASNLDPKHTLDVRGNIYCSDYVGIGGAATDSITVPLHVRSSRNLSVNEAVNKAYYAWNTSGRGIEINATVIGSTAISIISEQGIWIKGNDTNTGGRLWLTSDQRIKTNIVNLNADKMMNIFRHLRPISFDYITNMKNNNKKHFGFIAQEVNEVLPEGISLNTDVIPNNMMKGGITKPSETDEDPHFTLKPDDTDITLQYLLLTTDSPLKIDTANPYSSKDTYKFKIYGGDKWAKEHDIYIRSDYNVTDDKYTYVIGMKKEAYDVVITESTLFVYGQYVNDLHILDHDTIYTVATAALQEVDRQQQADKARIAELEATVAAQQSLINDILERLKKVEKA